MVVGLLVGYLINRSITVNKFEYDRSYLNSINDERTRQKATEAIAHFEETSYSSQKKSIAENFSILSDIFLHLIKMIIAPLVLAVLVIGVAKVGDFKSVGRIGLKTLIYFYKCNIDRPRSGISAR